MCTSDGKTSEVLSKGPWGGGLSRRAAFSIFAGGVVGGALGAIIDNDGICNGPGEDGQKEGSWAPNPVLEKHTETSFPVTVNLGIVAVAATGLDRHKGNEEIWKIVSEQMRRITRTTSGAYTFKLHPFHDTSPPDMVPPGSCGAVYSTELLRRMADEYHQKLAELGGSAIVLLVIDTADTERQYASGLAYQDLRQPWIVVRAREATNNTYAHEVGHTLDPEGLGFGLGHELMMDCRIRSESGKPKQNYAFDTIQNLIESGCGLVKGKDGKVDEYASYFSVMGNGGVFLDDGREGRPVFSPAGLAFLDPRRRVEKVDVAQEKKYYIDYYDLDQLFGIAADIPEDHVLRQILPHADTLFFGPIASSTERINNDVTPEELGEIRRIGAFATGNNGRSTALLDIGLFNEFEKGLPGRPRVHEECLVYADDQLNVLVVAGRDINGATYIRTVPLDTPEGRDMLARERVRVAERDALIINGAQKADGDE